MSDEPVRHGLGDPRIPWVVLLDLAWSDPPPVAALTSSLAAVAAEAGWPVPQPGAVTSGERGALLRALATSSAEPLRLGRYRDGVVLAARHDALDGLAMLTAARRLLGEVRSTARGLSPRDVSPGGNAGADALLRRGWEVLARPSARVAGSRERLATGEAFATAVVDGSPRTADLVHAGARAVATWNREHGRDARRTSVAVGASLVGGTADELADDSAYLRLTGVEAMSLEQVRSALAQAPVQPGGGGGRRGPAGRVLGAALRLAAPRLGSTLLVSHLGTLDAADRLLGAAFYPVTGGGSGLSLGAAALRGRTTLTLRGRAARYDDDALQHLLERVVVNLD